jgi:hypothetical protein
MLVVLSDVKLMILISDLSAENKFHLHILPNMSVQ